MSTDLQEHHEKALTRDPSRLTWPATLPIELALKTATPAELQQEYGYSDEDWAALRYNPVFTAELTEAVELVRKEGMGFKLKARLQAEELLETSWRLIHAPASEVASTVKADLIKSTMRWAGYEQKPGAETGGPGTGFAIQINLGSLPVANQTLIE